MTDHRIRAAAIIGIAFTTSQAQTCGGGTNAQGALSSARPVNTTATAAVAVVRNDGRPDRAWHQRPHHYERATLASAGHAYATRKQRLAQDAVAHCDGLDR